jgi:predicted DCC family thiol-disulfide oxidoreductase YuxK
MPDLQLDRPLLVFDGDCSFCRIWVDYWKLLTVGRVDCAPYQEVSERFPGISREEFANAAKLIFPDGEIRSAAHAVFSVLATAPGSHAGLWAYRHIPGFAVASEAAYQVIANHRSFSYRLTRFLWGRSIIPETWRLSSWLFLRALGAIYLIAFLSFGIQAAGLIGSHGILPLSEYLHAAHTYFGSSAYWNVPTIFWLSQSDALLRADWMAGACLSVLVLAGVNWRVLLVLLFVLYLSLATAGQLFMSYQWDALLLEAGFLAIFLGGSPVLVRLFRWLLCRFMFLSGAVKLASGDPNWRHFTALPVHYETQPLPTPLAWYVFQFPAWFHRVCVGFVFFVELLMPFLILAPRRLRHFAAAAIITLQILIFLTGNFAFFNLLTIALCIFLFDDAALANIVPNKICSRISPQTLTPGALRIQPPHAPWRTAFYAGFAVVLLLISAYVSIGELTAIRWPVFETLARAVGPFEIINTYGLFANMTTTRPEIVIEGSNDGQTWLAYEFKYKAGDLNGRPVYVEPHQPRLDWQMWFAALGDAASDPWIIHFMARLLQGSPEVLRLLHSNPFPSAPPHFVRALVYQYRFTSPEEKKATGNWWRRELKGMYVSPLALRPQ